MNDGPITFVPAWALAELIEDVRGVHVYNTTDPTSGYPSQLVTYCDLCEGVEGHTPECFLGAAERAYERNSPSTNPLQMALDALVIARAGAEPDAREVVQAAIDALRTAMTTR